MTILLRSVYLLLMSVVLGSCIPIPVQQDEPFPHATEKLLEEPTSREYIYSLLGEPASYEQGSKWVYTAPEIEWAMGNYGGGSTILQGQQHFLILHFDDQDVVEDHRFESAAPSPFSCTPSLYCHDGAYGVVRFADKITESQVKDFHITQGECGLYLYGQVSLERTVFLDGEKMGSYFIPNSFFFWNIEPGQHEIAVHHGTDVSVSKLSVTCQESELIFIRLGAFFKAHQLSIIESAKGRKWVANKGRRLIYSESGSLADLPFRY